MQEKSKEILLKYKYYDSLNTSDSSPLVKIFVSYIKPSFLFKSEILTPVHLGKVVEKASSKDGILNERDLKWLHDNCEFNDDFEGGISKYNRRIGFLTGTYWAWKNYEKLGNPKYFGSFGYRRLLFPGFLENLKEYDIIAPKKTKWSISIKEEFSINNGAELYDIMENLINTFSECDIEDFKNYVNGKEGYYSEIYVMKKNIFFDFCEWIFPMIFFLLENYKETIKPAVTYKDRLNAFTDNSSSNFSKSDELRDIAFIAERLTGFYIYKMSKKVITNEVECIVINNEELCNIKKMILNKIRANLLNQ